MLWGETKPVFITHLQPVRTVTPQVCAVLNAYFDSSPATSGAAATIASDAFMNPFDGMQIRPSADYHGSWSH